MGITAENICEQWGLTREELDKFAADSQNKCEAAQKAGAFKDEIVPVEVKKKKETVIVDTDEGPRETAMIHLAGGYSRRVDVTGLDLPATLDAVLAVFREAA